MFDPQPIQEKDKVSARAWYQEHHSHVERMLSGYTGPAYPPSGSDCIRPELWKVAHWVWLLEVRVKIVLTQFAIDRCFDPDSAGTTITDRPAEQFESEIRDVQLLFPGYAPFCKLVFLRNWTDAHTGTMTITPENERWLKSEYKSRNDEELPVLVRWFEGIPEVPPAEYLCLVFYDREQLAKEGTDIGDADYGIVAILGQMHDQEEPMTPITAMRNALGVDEGGSGVPLDREAYRRSVEFWNTHAAVKVG